MATLATTQNKKVSFLPGAWRLEWERLLAVGLAVVVEDDVLLHAEALADAEVVEEGALLNLHETQKKFFSSDNMYIPSKNII